MVAIHQRVLQIMGYARKHDHLPMEGASIVYVRPRLDGYATFDFTSTEYFLAEGHRAVSEALGATPNSASRAREA